MSRQAYYKRFHCHIKEQKEFTIVLQLIQEVRQTHPRIGGRKLYAMLSESIQEHGIRMGRDALFNLLRDSGLLIRRRRRIARTTWSSHPYRKYKNLIKGFTPTAPNQLWVSDITYLTTRQGFLYLSLITDAYSRKIVGYDLADNLEAVNALNALQSAIGSLTPTHQLIHHSDRGIQYCFHEYTQLLQQHGIQISMTESGDPLENALAERVNGILKEEYLSNQPIQNKNQAMKLLNNTITLYNQHRPHLSCNMLTPEQVHQHHLPTKRLWKNYYPKKSNLVNQLQD